MKTTSSFWIKGMVTMALAMVASASGAQSFAQAHCGGHSADSTCYTAMPQQTCNEPPLAAQQTTNCPAGYVGKVNEKGTRDACTGSVQWTAATGDLPGCTDCGRPMVSAESQAILASVLEVMEKVNLAFVSYVFPGFSYVDGAAVKNPLNGMVVGHMFRDHVWVSPDGFSSGSLPTSNRVRYLLSQGAIPSNLPASPLLPKDPDGNPITNPGELYILALNAARASGTTTCFGDGMNGCSISCSTPTGGWQESFCKVKAVAFRSCSDSYSVYDGATWQPTSSVNVPYTSTSSKNYADKQWDWQTVFDWNQVSHSGGAVFLCRDTINKCNGWQTTSSVYQCRTPGSYDCSYQDPNTGAIIGAVCSSCDIAMGARWDYLLTQVNDCPLVPGYSTRATQNEPRLLWQADLPTCM